jgi:hypothetical protein
VLRNFPVRNPALLREPNTIVFLALPFTLYFSVKISLRKAPEANKVSFRFFVAPFTR